MGTFKGIDGLVSPLHHLNSWLNLAIKPRENPSAEQGMNFLTA